MKLIVAVNNKGYIGKKGEMMWHSPDDIAHFVKLTNHSSILVGRVTFEKDLKKKMLPGREVFVVGKGYLQLSEAVRAAKSTNKEIWVIGGASIYERLAPLCSEIHLSIIDNNNIGDRKFSIPKNYKGKVFKYHYGTRDQQRRH